MAEKQSRPVSLAGDQESGLDLNRGVDRASENRGGRMAVVLLSMVALLGQVATPALPASAQDTPAKNDVAPKSDAPQPSTPASPSDEPALSGTEALSVRYRFIERYSLTEDPNHPERVTQYRVGIRETQKTEREKQQGSPDRFQIAWQTIYTERAAQVNKLGEITSAVRRYDRFQMKEAAGARSPNAPLFEGLTIWYKLQPGKKPEVLNLTTDRPLREMEYAHLTKQVFLPQLTALLPQTPRLVGDTWSIPAKATQSLVGEMPSPEDYKMTGNLIEVRKAATGTALTAVIGVAGQLNLSTGLSSLNAQIHFVFSPTAAVLPSSGSGAPSRPAAKGGRRGNEGIMDAQGYVSRVLMAWKASNVLPDDEDRLKQTRTYELELERRLSPPPNVANAGQNAPLLIPAPIPTANEANSWLLYQDPMDRFYLLHPQNLELSPRMLDPNVLELVEQNHGTGKDVFILRLSPGPTDPGADRVFRDVKQFQHDIDADFLKNKRETLKGPAGWLPEAEWSPRKVFRKELAIISGGGEDQGKAVDRIYCDYYLVLSKRNECFQVQSMTIRDDHVACRTQSEGIIKSVQYGKWGAEPKAPAATNPAPPLKPPT